VRARSPVFSDLFLPFRIRFPAHRPRGVFFLPLGVLFIPSFARQTAACEHFQPICRPAPVPANDPSLVPSSTLRVRQILGLFQPFLR